ncbi:MAG: VOC family protein [Rhodospirillaceae bacterium]|nr:MAG: VOC family protein [Rhodospirillaceae bacterium]
MIDHLSLGVSNLAAARQYYDRVLASLGYVRLRDVDIPGQGLVAHGYGEKGGNSSFWIGVPEQVKPESNRCGGVHLAFAARSRADVDAFHAAALAAGGTDNGAPGLRPQYHADYYGAFAFDPDGNKIEACCHHPEP